MVLIMIVWIKRLLRVMMMSLRKPYNEDAGYIAIVVLVEVGLLFMLVGILMFIGWVISYGS